MLRFLFFFVFTWMYSNGINWHSSQIVLRRLYDLQNEQFAVIKDYLELETKRIRELERTLLPVFDWYVQNTFVKHAYILSHINGLKLMTRIHSNLPKVRNFLNNERSMEVLKKFDEDRAVSEFNVQSAHRALRRLQKVYSISATDMAAGRFKDRIIGERMDACECFVVSKYSFEEYDIYGARDWAIQAYNKWLDDRPKCVDIEKLHYYIKSTSIFTGLNIETLLNFRGLYHTENGEKFTQYFLTMKNELLVQNADTQSDIYDTYDNFEYLERRKNFRYLCRTGKSKRPLTNDSKCRYQTKNSLYRLLMPFKEEDISNSPNVKLYHDVLFDEEIRNITGMAIKDLTDAAYYINGKISVIEEKRLGQLKWFSKNSNQKLFGKLNERIESLTDFSTEKAEGYQAVNYGVGGHFSVHVDAFTDGLKMNGNRLVTVLFYMSDVHDNGYTVFPNINFVAHCRKGTALVWQNLYLNNGTVHSGTFHGGCPVLKGNKWIMTKGLYEGGQKLMYDWKANKQIIVV